MNDPMHTLPPRPEEDLAAAEEYRLCATPDAKRYVVITPWGPEVLRLTRGRVAGFDVWQRLAPIEVQQELTRELLDVAALGAVA